MQTKSPGVPPAAKLLIRLPAFLLSVVIATMFVRIGLARNDLPFYEFVVQLLSVSAIFMLSLAVNILIWQKS